MATMTMSDDDLRARQRRGVRRTLLVLVLLVLAFYLGFIWLAAQR